MIENAKEGLNYIKLDEFLLCLWAVTLWKGLSNEDLVMENADENVVHKCPITQKEISQPWKNPKCGHVYESEAITSYIKGRKNRKYSILNIYDMIFL